MIVVSIDRVTHHYGSQTVLQTLSWEIQSGRKIGLVGANGVGKSTLLRIIAGQLVASEGSVIRHKEVRVGHLAQEPELDPDRTVWEETLGAAGDLVRMQQALRTLEKRMADPALSANDAALQRVMTSYARTQERFEGMGGYRHESRAREALQRLGFSEEVFDQPTGTLSGGQKKMVGLAQLLTCQANLLLLDEPDNHLDLQRKARLEEIIRDFQGTVILVSHDRFLLDQTVDQIAEAEDGRVTLYSGNYTAYAVEKELRLLRQQQHYEAQQKEIARIEESIRRFEHWAHLVANERHARQARSRRKMLERMDKVERPTLEARRMDLNLEGWRGSTKVLEVIDLHKSFSEPSDDPAEEQIVLAGLNLFLWHGERVGLLGPNGSGKTVLVRCILGGLEPTAGEIRIGPSVRIGHYAQEHETLDPDKTLIEEVRQVRQMYEDQAVSFLGGLLFPYEMTRKRVRELSGGERSRLQLAKLMLSGANFLLLDEPTNNLDLPSCEVLEQSLDRFEGTVLVVSHDRYLLDRVVDRIIELDDGTLAEYPGDYTAYREQKERRALA